MTQNKELQAVLKRTYIDEDISRRDAQVLEQKIKEKHEFDLNLYGDKTPERGENRHKGDVRFGFGLTVIPGIPGEREKFEEEFEKLYIPDEEKEHIRELQILYLSTNVHSFGLLNKYQFERPSDKPVRKNTKTGSNVHFKTIRGYLEHYVTLVSSPNKILLTANSLPIAQVEWEMDYNGFMCSVPDHEKFTGHIIGRTPFIEGDWSRLIVAKRLYDPRKIHCGFSDKIFNEQSHILNADVFSKNRGNGYVSSTGIPIVGITKYKTLDNKFAWDYSK